MAQLKFWQAINHALRAEMARDPRVVIFGEDVGKIGGPFGASRGLLEAFGPQRVRDTPISEAAIVGVGLGAALNGLRPVAEVMFMDFVTLAMDQLVNQSAKMAYMSGGKMSVPLVVRTLCGAGRGTGPQHGQSLEAWLAHVPGLKVVWPSCPTDAKGLLQAAIRDDDPVVFVESLNLWNTREEVPDGDCALPIGKGVVRRAGRDVTVVAWGSAVPRALTAATDLARRGIEAEVLDLRSLSPLDEELVLGSLSRTGRLVVVHDAVAPFGPGAEIAALAASKGFAALKAPVVRVTAPFSPVPFAPELERVYFPQPEAIAGAVTALLAG